MKLLSIRVESFGKLKGLTLEPQAGLNRYCHPNEFGKSTLMAFIYFIFYGYDSKWMKSYFPWEGGPLSGSITFSLAGKEWQIFRHHPQKGAERQQVLDLSAGKELVLAVKEKPGPKLLGLDGETFLRTFFVRQGELFFDRTDGLDTALKNLAATGDENASFQQALEYLQKEHSRYMYRGRTQGPLLDLQTGILQKGDALAALEREIEARIAEKRQLEVLKAQKADLEATLSGIDGRLAQAEKNDAARRLDALLQLERAGGERPRSEATDALLSEQEQAFLKLQEAEGLLKEQRNQQEMARQTLQNERHRLEALYLPPDTGAHLARFEKGNRGGLIAGILLLALAIACGVGGLYLPLLWIVAAASALSGIFFCIKEPLAKGQLYRRYGVADLAALKARWSQYQQARAQVEAQEQSGGEADAALQEQERKVEALRATLQSLTLQTRLLSLEELKQEQFDRAVRRQTAENILLQKEKLLKGRTLEDWRAAAEGGDSDGETYEQVFAEKQSALSALERILAGLSGKDLHALSALWRQAEELRREIGEERAREARWKQALSAVKCSIQWLEEANEDMTRHFAPRLCKGAGEYLSLLTDGAYEAVQMDEQYHIRIETAAGAYPISHFSKGTRDAVYFAFRLGVGELLSESSLPLLLDDPFVNLDDERLKNAETMLERCAERRQILYFTCRQ